MKIWTRVVLGLAAVAALGAWFFLRTPVTPGLNAKSPEGGFVVEGYNGKVRHFPNDVYKIEPESFSVSPSLRELPDAKDSKEPFESVEERMEERRFEEYQKQRVAKGLPRLTEEQKEAWEINQRNNERVKKIDPNAKHDNDPLAKNSLAPNAPQTMPTPIATWDGAGMADNASAGADTGFTPPDVNGDVGPNHYVSSINLVLKIYDKNGTVIAAGKKTSDLFVNMPAGDPCKGRNDGDPVVVYDPLADRWVITQFSLPAGIDGSGSNNYECIAVSKTADPTGEYYTWTYVYPGNALNDYPKIGVWTDSYNMTFNQFNNAGTSWLGAGLFSQDRIKALAGDPTASAVYKNLFSIDQNAGGQLPVDIDGIVPPPAGLSPIIAEFRATEYSDPLDAIRYYKWQPDFATPANTVFAVLPDVALAPFDANSTTSGSEITVSGGATLDGLNDRMMHRFAYRNLGSYASPTNSYVGNFTVNVSGTTPATATTYQGGIRWFEMRRTGDTFTVRDQGTQANGPGNGTGVDNWMGSIAQDNQGNIALGYSSASPTTRADIKWAGRTGTATAGTLNEGEATMFAAPAVQTSSNRWGDYSSMTVDPSDDCTFFYTQEYYNATSSSNFSTRVGKFKFPGCTDAPKATIQGTITNCAGGAAIQSAAVNATGGFNRLSAANGTYSMIVAPGSYTLSASKTGGFNGANQSTTVTAGQTATVDICLAPVPLIASSAPSITSESCGLPNGSADPGENVTVSLPLTNTGAANTTNLVATLVASGGVTNPGPAQTYGVVTAGGPAVSKNFTFTVDPATSCGGSVVMTWNLTDGATSFGTVTANLSTGTPVINLTQNFDGVTAPALPAGWVQNQTSGTLITWTTVNTAPVSSAPNVAFANDPDTVNATAIESPSFAVNVPNASLTFKKAFTTESTYDGVVLEIQIGSGAWQDIIAAGGSFQSGGYNATISSSFSSPIGGRQAWSGSSATISTTQATLPATANGQNVKLRWLMASDSSVASTGFRLDDVQVQAGVQCNTCQAQTVKSRADFDGDGKSDVSVFRGSEGNWYLNRSTAGFGATNWGLSSDIIVPADYDGDNKADTAIFRPSTGQWYILRSGDGGYSAPNFGSSGDIPQAGDYDGDGKADLAVFRPSTNVWYIIKSSDNAVVVTTFGASGDVPVRGDYDGDGKTDVAIFRGSTNEWWISKSTGGLATSTFGLAGDKPVPADYDGDNKDDIAMFRPSTGVWYVLRSTDGTVGASTFGISTDVPVPGDYDGDGKDDVAVYRNGTWWINRSTAGLSTVGFGISTDVPTLTKYIP